MPETNSSKLSALKSILAGWPNDKQHPDASPSFPFPPRSRPDRKTGKPGTLLKPHQIEETKRLRSWILQQLDTGGKKGTDPFEKPPTDWVAPETEDGDEIRSVPVRKRLPRKRRTRTPTPPSTDDEISSEGIDGDVDAGFTAEIEGAIVIDMLHLRRESGDECPITDVFEEGGLVDTYLKDKKEAGDKRIIECGDAPPLALEEDDKYFKFCRVHIGFVCFWFPEFRSRYVDMARRAGLYSVLGTSRRFTIHEYLERKVILEYLVDTVCVPLRQKLPHINNYDRENIEDILELSEAIRKAEELAASLRE